MSEEQNEEDLIRQIKEPYPHWAEKNCVPDDPMAFEIITSSAVRALAT